MLSVLMPLKHYHPGFLGKAIGSLFGQSDPAWRLLIIAERSDLPAFRNLLASELEDPRVALIANEGRGLSAAFNTGMRKATTEFVAILLADDMWAPEAVELLHRYIDRHPAIDFFHTSRMIIDDEDRPISSVHRSRDTFESTDFLHGSPVKHLLCWRTAFALSFGGMDEALPPVGPDDYDFPWCMADAGAAFLAVPECLYLYRDHREAFRLTTHLPLEVHRRGIRRILEKHGASAAAIESRLAASEESYLRQCLYVSRDDKIAKDSAGYDPRTGWRERYR
jgi:glycosyltransferase involved in cell wall biosynthesis